MFLDTARRASCTLLTGAVAAGLCGVVTAPTAQAEPDPANNPSVLAVAAWLDGQFDENNTFTFLDFFGNPFSDLGTSIDLGLGLIDAGVAPATLDRVKAGVDAAIEEYVGAEPDAAKAGQAAKAAHFYKSLGVSTTVGGIDLIQRVEDLVDGTGQLGSFPNVYSQVWAVPALEAAGSSEAAAATDFLIDQQCVGAAWGYGSGDTCTSDVDATAWTVLALLPQYDDVDPQGADVRAAVDAGVTWLKEQQLADGGFGAFGANTNSTALAAWALDEAGADVEARKAGVWVRSRQIAGYSCDRALSNDDGAVAYDDDAITNGLADGITEDTRGQWIIASAQAIPALLRAPAPTGVTGLKAPRFVKAGSTVTLTTTGLATGQRGCVSLAGNGGTVIGGSKPSIALKVPAGTKAYTAVATSPTTGQAKAPVTALAPKTLTVLRRSAIVRPGGQQVVRVTGLVRGERVLVRYGTKVINGVANSSGEFRTSFAVGRVKGLKTVVSRGQFDTRRGSVTFRVR